MNVLSRTFAVIAASMTAFLAFPAHADQEVNVYSYRQPFLIKPMFEAFTRETGIDVNVVYAKKGLLQRLNQEGANSPADLIFTVDIGRLTEAVNAGVTQPAGSAALKANIPPQYQDPGHLKQDPYKISSEQMLYRIKGMPECFLFLLGEQGNNITGD